MPNMGGGQSRQEQPIPHNTSSSDTYYRMHQDQPFSPNSSYSSNSVRHDEFDIRRFTRFGDDYHSVEQVTQALAHAGLESSNLIVGIDFTKSNEWTGSRSFNRRSLHHLGETPNPYEQAISIIGRTLHDFDEDNLIPCFGFGDGEFHSSWKVNSWMMLTFFFVFLSIFAATTHDQEVFSFYSDNRPCNGFEEVLSRYRELTPHLHLAGPTSFAPIVETAIGIVDSSGGQYHVLVIIADGQVTRSVDTSYDQLSPQERITIDAIVKASYYPLSIVLVGVGDGPWDMMHKFDDNIPSRAFDNFQFVNFTEIMLKNTATSRKEADFALAALMEIPSQYKATIDLQLLGCRRGTNVRSCLPPPVGRTGLNSYPAYQQSSYNYEQRNGFPSAPSAPSSSHSRNSLNCPLCLWTTKDLAFGCGHQTCYECGRDLDSCPVCQTHITTRVRLY